MQATLLQACAKDLVLAKRDGNRLEAVLGEGYPVSLLNYARTVSPEAFVLDMEAILPSLVSGMVAFPVRTRAGSAVVQRELRLAERLAHEPVVGRAPLPSAEFLHDLETFLKGSVPRPTEEVPNGFVDAMLEASRNEIAAWLDHVPLPASHTALHDVLAGMLANETEQQALNGIADWLRREGRATSVVIQSARRLAPDEKQAYRSALRKRYPDAFVLFQVEPQVFGGLRVFVRGKLEDRTWSASVSQIVGAMPTLR